MDLEVARKSLSERNAFPTKKIAFAVVAGLVLVAGIALRVSHYLGEALVNGEPAAVEAPAPEAAPPPTAESAESVPKTPPVTQEAAPAPSEQAEQVNDTAEQTKPEGDAVGQSEQADLPGAGMILVSRKPIEVRAGPSASAPAMFGFPAGRPFRVIGREGGFVRIQDLKSSASGWIDETALAAPPPRAPSVAAPSQSKPEPSTASADPKPKAAKKDAPATADSEVAEPYPTQTRRPPVLFGKGGFFGGVFGNGNTN
jgi:hypothetical protein